MPSEHRVARAVAAGFAVCALLVGVACAGDDDTDGTTDGNGTVPAAQPTEATTPLPSEGGESTPGASAPATVALEACALVTREEAEAALGEPVAEGEPALVGEIETCSYAPATGGSIGSVQVAYLTRGIDAAAFPGVLTEAAEADLEPIAGIGDAAFWDGDQVVVLIGEVAISAIAIPPSDATTSAADRDASTELARIAAGRVP